MRGDSSPSRAFLFIGGPAHGQVIATEYNTVRIPVLEKPDATFRYDDEDPTVVAVNTVVYRRFEVATTVPSDRYPDLGTAYTRFVMAPADWPLFEVEARLRDYLFREWIKSAPDHTHEGVRV